MWAINSPCPIRGNRSSRSGASSLKVWLAKYVDLYEFPDGTLEVRSKGRTLPYRVFSKDQRAGHTAIVENNRLNQARTIIKAQQDVRHEPKVQTNSEKGGYKKNPRQLYGADYKAKVRTAPAVEMTS